jgi:hypothetical protein
MHLIQLWREQSPDAIVHGFKMRAAFWNYFITSIKSKVTTSKHSGSICPFRMERAPKSDPTLHPALIHDGCVAVSLALQFRDTQNSKPETIESQIARRARNKRPAQKITRNSLPRARALSRVNSQHPRHADIISGDAKMAEE